MTDEALKVAPRENRPAPRENPLVPFALMRRMYAGMVESRLLEVDLAKRRGEKGSPVEGREACRAAVLLSLETDDLVLDAAGAPGAAWLRGEELGKIVAGRFGSLLPAFEGGSQQLRMALGAALVLKRTKVPWVVTIFIDPATKRGAFRPVLAVAAKEELPLLFVAFASATGKSVAASSTKLGVPGIPVEGNDAVAICRVAQESILRARAGAGRRCWSASVWRAEGVGLTPSPPWRRRCCGWRLAIRHGFPVSRRRLRLG